MWKKTSDYLKNAVGIEKTRSVTQAAENLFLDMELNLINDCTQSEMLRRLPDSHNYGHIF